MDIFELAAELGKALKNDERLQRLENAKKAYEADMELQKMMVEYRATPPQSILGSKVVEIYDYKTLELKNTVTGEVSPIPGIEDKSNVLQWITEDGTKVSVRPSGTEPKIKFYFGVKAELPTVEQFDEVQAALDAKIEAIKKELKLV